SKRPCAATPAERPCPATRVRCRRCNHAPRPAMPPLAPLPPRVAAAAAVAVLREPHVAHPHPFHHLVARGGRASDPSTREAGRTLRRLRCALLSTEGRARRDRPDPGAPRRSARRRSVDDAAGCLGLVRCARPRHAPLHDLRTASGGVPALRDGWRLLPQRP